MKKILFVDENTGFLSDLESRCFLEDDVVADTVNNMDEAIAKDGETDYDEIVVSGALTGEIENDTFRAPTATYALKEEDILATHEKGIRTYGIQRNSGALLSAVIKGEHLVIKSSADEKAGKTKEERAERREPEYYDDESDLDGPHGQDRGERYDARRDVRDRDMRGGRYDGRYGRYDGYYDDRDGRYDDRYGRRDRYYDDRDGFYDDRYAGREHLGGRESGRYDGGYAGDAAYRDAGPDRGHRDERRDDQPGGRGEAYRSASDVYDSGRAEYRDGRRENQPDARYGGSRAYRESDRYPEDAESGAGYGSHPGGRSAREPQDAPAAAGVRERLEEERRRSGADGRRKPSDRAARDEVERDLGNVRDPAKIITVYSAKGGVGKTTVSCELASFFALSAHGRDRFRVCLVDFNVDFGDVLNTLNLDSRRPGMSAWSAEIKERLERDIGPAPYNDEDLERIVFSGKEIRQYLQTVDESGLSVLIAPISNEDSMELMEDGEDIAVMLRNLRDNGDFDIIICDTGNNTRNSAFIPLEMADSILMIVTQSVNTANCNSSFLSTLHAIGFDTRKLKIVVNRARAKKNVGVSVDELLEVMVDPTTGRQIECAGVIKENQSASAAENKGVPVVYDPSDPFTKSIAQIAKAVNGDAYVLKKPEKKSLFGALGKKKR